MVMGKMKFSSSLWVQTRVQMDAKTEAGAGREERDHRTITDVAMSEGETSASLDTNRVMTDLYR